LGDGDGLAADLVVNGGGNLWIGLAKIETFVL
jgi:hypothetical protein